MMLDVTCTVRRCAKIEQSRLRAKAVWVWTKLVGSTLPSPVRPNTTVECEVLDGKRKTYENWTRVTMHLPRSPAPAGRYCKTWPREL